MGGAGVAVADDSYAAYWNPAALAFQDKTPPDGVLPAGGHLSIEGDLLRDANRIDDFIRANLVSTLTLPKIAVGLQLTSATDLRNALTLTTQLLPTLDREGDGIRFNTGIGLMGRGRRFALSGIGFGQYAADPVLDLQNLSFNNNTTSAAQRVSNLFLPGAVDRSGAFTNPASQGLANTIAAIFTAAGIGAPAQNQAEELIFQAELAGVNTGDPRSQQILTSIASATANGTGDLQNNNTGVLIRGAMTAEVGLSYGHPIKLPAPLLDHKLGIGGSLKYIYGTTFSRFRRYDDIDPAEVVDDLNGSKNSKTSHNVGIDLGILYKPTDSLRVGLVGRNLNNPSFARVGASDFVLARQIRGGAAFNLTERWILAGDIDLLENKSENLSGFRSRLASAGTEYVQPLGPLSVALRGGVYSNLGSGAEKDLAITLGLGFEVAGFSLNLAAGGTPSTREVETGSNPDELPSRADVSASLRWAGSF